MLMSSESRVSIKSGAEQRAMVEDLIMEFEETPPQIEPGLAQLRAVQRSIEDALVPLMTGVVQLMGWMR